MPIENTGESGWRIVFDAAVSPAAVGLTRIDGLADELIGDSSAPMLLVWRSQRALFVTRKDLQLPLFEAACTDMAAVGWPVAVRRSGGGPCPVGPGTVQVATIAIAAPGATMDKHYEVLTGLMQAALRRLHVDTQVGLIAVSYCPGRYDLSVRGMKIAGISQHWFRNRVGMRCVVTAASINVEEPPSPLADAVNRYHSRIGNQLRCRAGALTSARLCQAAATEPCGLIGAVMAELANVAAQVGDPSANDRYAAARFGEISVSPKN